jgi:hypothetical protein
MSFGTSVRPRHVPFVDSNTGASAELFGMKSHPTRLAKLETGAEDQHFFLGIS